MRMNASEGMTVDNYLHHATSMTTKSETLAMAGGFNDSGPSLTLPPSNLAK